jgi:hypothetical protein
VLNNQKIMDKKDHSEGLKEGVDTDLKYRRLKSVNLILLARDKSSWKLYVNIRVP